MKVTVCVSVCFTYAQNIIETPRYSPLLHHIISLVPLTGESKIPLRESERREEKKEEEKRVKAWYSSLLQKEE